MGEPADTSQLITLDLPFAERPPRRLTIEPTHYCDVGCSFCKYAPPRQPRRGEKHPALHLSEEAVAEVLRYLSEAEVRELLITGGGEPTHELDTVLTLVSRAAVDRVSIYTAAQWADAVSAATEFMATLDDAARDAPCSEVILRLSLDRYHEDRIGRLPVGRVLTAYRDWTADTKLRVAIRTLFGDQEQVREVVEAAGGQVRWRDGSRSVGAAHLNGRNVPIHAAGLVPTGRMNVKKLASAPEPPIEELDRHYSELNGSGWPVLYDGGWNIGIRPSGDVYVYGGAPRDYGQVPRRPLSECVQVVGRDPLNLALAHGGLRWMRSLFASLGIDYDETRRRLREPSVLIPLALRDTDLLLRAQLTAVEELARTGLIDAEAADRLISSYDGTVGHGAPATAVDVPTRPSHAVRVALGMRPPIKSSS